MMNHVIHVANMNLHYARVHVEDIPPEQMCLQPRPQVNHPAWILGHITLAYAGAGALLGVECALPEQWQTLFAFWEEPCPDPAAHPSKDDLWAAYERCHGLVTSALPGASAELLASPLEDEMMSRVFPTSGDMITAVLTIHEGVHLGQLSAWRRQMGMALHI
ncbi:MAG: DinB family protein [Lentisphaerae bacterium]|jgi:hypothetical protein|nr:DinB family protein [Lentisphaerota bacterium]MBT5607430.1 DinB family protein [Lentisphaerota bacterium]MBT7056138.1 DinB family protein [Lentisphaerota bacterium]MBT7841376.1 DinB family protein [Lentisphaerota bacterium]